MAELLPVLVLFGFVAIFGVILAIAGSIFGPKVHQSLTKKSSYECGLDVQETGHSKIPVKFYLTAILFILFDIEIIFMYPWAITYMDFINADHGMYIFVGMGVFLLLFIFGLFWEIKSKALEWE